MEFYLRPVPVLIFGFLLWMLLAVCHYNIGVGSSGRQGLFWLSANWDCELQL